MKHRKVVSCPWQWFGRDHSVRWSERDLGPGGAGRMFIKRDQLKGRDCCSTVNQSILCLPEHLREGSLGPFNLGTSVEESERCTGAWKSSKVRVFYPGSRGKEVWRQLSRSHCDWWIERTLRTSRLIPSIHQKVNRIPEKRRNSPKVITYCSQDRMQTQVSWN